MVLRLKKKKKSLPSADWAVEGLLTYQRHQISVHLLFNLLPGWWATGPLPQSTRPIRAVPELSSTRLRQQSPPIWYETGWSEAPVSQGCKIQAAPGGALSSETVPRLSLKRQTWQRGWHLSLSCICTESKLRMAGFSNCTCARESQGMKCSDLS